MKTNVVPVDESRRDFIKKSVTGMAGLSVVPGYILGGKGLVPPNDKITVACIGVGSQGLRVMMDLLRYEEIQVISVCDVNSGSSGFVEWGENELRNKVRRLLEDSDWGNNLKPGTAGLNPAKEVVEAYYSKKTGKEKYKGCSTYTDYRELLEKSADVDAVIVCTPDHTHACISIAAMRKGKHVFCQKPMTHTVLEARKMSDMAVKTGLATQVAIGNQASESTRIICEWIWSGAIGQVLEVHNWSDRPYWPQGINRPEKSEKTPDYLNWDLWLGPAPERPYHSVYQPFVWRGWFDFGTSSIGDMGCYSFDTLFRVLKLDAPESIHASSTQIFPETYPLASVIHFKYPARGEQLPVTIHWYDAGIKPSLPDAMEGKNWNRDGMLFVGETGKILCDFNGGNPKLIPESAMNSYEPPPKTLPRSPGNYEEWINAVKDGKPGGANFEFSGKVTETILLGNVAVRTGSPIDWDSKNLKITNNQEVNKFIQMPYRNGWEL